MLHSSLSQCRLRAACFLCCSFKEVPLSDSLSVQAFLSSWFPVPPGDPPGTWVDVEVLGCIPPHSPTSLQSQPRGSQDLQ